MPIQIKELISSDSLSQAIEKLNFNFDQLILSGGGPPGPIGISGPTGPDGSQGERGSVIKVSASSSVPGSVAVLGGFKPNDKIIDAGGTVWNYNGAVWTDTTVNLRGPDGAPGTSGAGSEYNRYKGISNGGWVPDPASPGARNETAKPDFFGYKDNDQVGINVHVLGHISDIFNASTNAAGSKFPAETNVPAAVIMQSNNTDGIYLGVGGKATRGSSTFDDADFDHYATISKTLDGSLSITGARSNSVLAQIGSVSIKSLGALGIVTLNSGNQNASIKVGDSATGNGDILSNVQKNNASVKLQAKQSTFSLKATTGGGVNANRTEIKFNTDEGGSAKDRLAIYWNGKMRTSNSLKINSSNVNDGMHWGYACKIFRDGDASGDDFGISLGGGIVNNIIWANYWKNEENGAGYRIDLNEPKVSSSSGLPTTDSSDVRFIVAGDSRNKGGSPTHVPTVAGTNLNSSSTPLLVPIKLQTYDGKIKLQDDSKIIEGVTVGRHNMPSDFLYGVIQTTPTAAAGLPLYKTLLIGSRSNYTRPRLVVGYNDSDYTILQHITKINSAVGNDAVGMIGGKYNNSRATQSNLFTWGSVSGSTFPNTVPSSGASITTQPVVFNFGSYINDGRTINNTDKVNIAGGIKLTENSLGFSVAGGISGSTGYANIGRHYSDIMINNSNTKTTEATSRSTIYFGSITKDPKEDLRLGNNLSTGGVGGATPYSSVNIRSNSLASFGNGITLWDRQVGPTTGSFVKAYAKSYINKINSTSYQYIIEARAYGWNSNISLVNSDDYIDMDIHIKTYSDGVIQLNSENDIKLNADNNIELEANKEISLTAIDQVYIQSLTNHVNIGAPQGDIYLESKGNHGKIFVKSTNTSGIAGELLISGSIDSDDSFGKGTIKKMAVIKASNFALGSANYDNSVIAIGAGADSSYPFLFINRGYIGAGREVEAGTAYGNGIASNVVGVGRTRLHIIGQGNQENVARLQTDQNRGILIDYNGSTRISGQAQIANGHRIKRYRWKILGRIPLAIGSLPRYRWRFVRGVTPEDGRSAAFDNAAWHAAAANVNFEPDIGEIDSVSGNNTGYAARVGFQTNLLNLNANPEADFDRFLQWSRTTDRHGVNTPIDEVASYAGDFVQGHIFVREMSLSTVGTAFTTYRWVRVASVGGGVTQGTQGGGHNMSSFIPAGCKWAIGCYSKQRTGTGNQGDVVGDVVIFKMGGSRNVNSADTETFEL